MCSRPTSATKSKAADIVIDHHPGYGPHGSAFQDLRPKYGATSTIMTEYMINADEHISERLATALLYGIRTDTVMLSRRVTDDDVLAFTHLYPIANYSLLRQFERPELPLQFAKILSRAMRRLEVKDGLVVLNLGRVARDDLIVQMADFCLQFEGVQWVAVAGKLGPNLVVALRNHGNTRQPAGEVAKGLVGDIGSGGGHRDMAKAVIPLARVANPGGNHSRHAHRGAPARTLHRGIGRSGRGARWPSCGAALRHILKDCSMDRRSTVGCSNRERGGGDSRNQKQVGACICGPRRCW